MVEAEKPVAGRQRAGYDRIRANGRHRGDRGCRFSAPKSNAVSEYYLFEADQQFRY